MLVRCTKKETYKRMASGMVVEKRLKKSAAKRTEKFVGL